MMQMKKKAMNVTASAKRPPLKYSPLGLHEPWLAIRSKVLLQFYIKLKITFRNDYYLPNEMISGNKRNTGKGRLKKWLVLACSGRQKLASRGKLQTDSGFCS